MSFYDDMKTVATNLLTEFGQLHTFTSYAQGAYDPGTGTNTVTTSTYSKNAVKYPYNTVEKNNTAIEVGDIRLIAEFGDYSVGDTVTIDSVDWRIMDVEPITPGATNVANMIQLRR